MQLAFNSQAVATDVGVSPRYVQKLTKAALAAGMASICCKGVSYAFSLVQGIGGRGEVYSYTSIQAAKGAGVKPKRKVKSNYTFNPSDLPKIGDLKRFSLDEKLAIIRFYNVSQVPLGYIVKALIMQHGADIKPSSLQAKIKRWARDFKAHGGSALEDKRGGKSFKSDLDLVRQAILGAGSRHYTSLYGFYCWLYADKQGEVADLRNPKADVSESAFNRAVKHLTRVEPLLKDYLSIGMDAFIYAEPSFGRLWAYPNQQWEIDATPLDLMVKVPVVPGLTKGTSYRDYESRDMDAEFQLVRMSLIRVIDNFSGATVIGLYESSNSYANARLMYQAFKLLGKPEIIKGDNGGDFVSEHLQHVFVDLGIEYIATGKARGDEKGMIERSFRSLQHSAAFEALPGFVGHNVDQRQHLEAQASTKLEKLSGVATNIKGDFMWHWQADSWLANYLLEKDAEKYAQHADQQVDEAQQAEIFRRLGKKTKRRVSKEGIRHRNTHFLSYDMWDTLTIGDDVVIQEHLDDSTIVFLYKDDIYLGEIQDKNIFQQSQTVEQLKGTKKQYRQRVSNDVKGIAKAAQKGFRGYQNGMRDEYIGLEVVQAKTRKEFDKQKQGNGTEKGFDPEAAFIEFALRQVI
ncbi:MAG: transposase family protein [Mariprofundus sp.]|nr:transposase family protein [Mariprofundus sp.]